MELLKSAESSAPNLTAKRVCGGCKQFTFQSLKENTPVAGLCSRETHWQSAGVLKHTQTKTKASCLSSEPLSFWSADYLPEKRQKPWGTQYKPSCLRSSTYQACLAWASRSILMRSKRYLRSAPLKSTLVCLSKADMHESEIVRAFAELLNYTESESSRLAAFLDISKPLD